MVIENVTGWNALMTGNITGAAFTALNEPTGGWLILMLFIIITLVLWIRTQSVELCTIISFIFLGVFLTQPWFTRETIGIAVLITAFLLGATIFKLVSKEKNY